ncbi:hypothetical protein Efla_001903 [Eimeria flavescens]
MLNFRTRHHIQDLACEGLAAGHAYKGEMQSTWLPVRQALVKYGLPSLGRGALAFYGLARSRCQLPCASCLPSKGSQGTGGRHARLTPLRVPPLSCKDPASLISRLSACVNSQASREVHSMSAARRPRPELLPELREGLQRLGILKLTEMQRLCLLRTLRGGSLAVAASPGAGKTLAYLLPVLHQLVNEGERKEQAGGSPRPPFALLLLPSRELAKQVLVVATALLPRASILVLDPTTALRHQQQMLDHLAPQVLVATPDRVLSLLRQKKEAPATKMRAAAAAGSPWAGELCVEKLRFLVVDEADALLRRDYLTKVVAVYRAAAGAKAVKGNNLEAEADKPTRDSLQMLFYTAVLTPELRALIDSNFPSVEVLDLVASDGRQPLKRANAEHTEQQSGGRDSTQEGKASVGAGVKRHICYVASALNPPVTGSSSLDAFADSQRSLEPSGRSSRRIKLTDEDTQLERERKMLGLVEVLREHIPTVMYLGKGARKEAPHQAEATATLCASSSGLSRSCSNTEAQAPSTEPTTQQLQTADPPIRKTTPQCIIFADSHAEASICVRYISQHPLLDGWSVAAVRSSMDPTERQHAMQSFVEGGVSVLVCTDVAARGLDIPSVVLVVHMHPPTPPVNYTHRTGRAGRGEDPGTSVVLCSQSEIHRQRDVERMGKLSFERRALPAVTECQELILRQLTADLLDVPRSQYEPLLDLAKRLHAKVGANALATTFLKLGGLSSLSAPGLPSSDCQSVLSGRRGFVPLLLYDPTHQRLDSSMDARRFLLSLLPPGASIEGVGRLVKSAKGFVADVSLTYVDHVLQEGVKREKLLGEVSDKQDGPGAADCEAHTTWVPVFRLERLPRLLNQGVGRRKRGNSLFRSKQQVRQGAAVKQRVLESSAIQVQALKNAASQTISSRA